MIVLDEFAPADTLSKVLDEWPEPGRFTRKRSQTSIKGHISDIEKMGPATREFVYSLNAPPFLNYIEQVFDLPRVYSDPWIRGGGLHEIEPGGYLKIHVDFNYSRKLQKTRAVNLLLFLNRGWHDEWGGHFEMWSEDMQQCEHKVAPEFNRCVMFRTTDRSFHGHPEPLRSPGTRKSIAMYYYCDGEPKKTHSTVYVQRPGKD